MESAGITAPPAPAQVGAKGLKKNAIGFLDGLSIGLASTAPAYSIAAVLGSIVVAVGVQAPAVLLTSFVPMFFIAAAFFYLNRADQDCGTTFSWVTRAMGPWAGWMGGWAICTTGILVIGSLADISAFYAFDLLGLTELRRSRVAVVALAVLIIAVMTLIVVIGTELSAHLQRVLTLGQVGILLLFAVVALVKVFAGDAAPRSVDPEASWFSPFAVDGYSSLLTGLLLGVFIYWGWESAVNLTEETEDSARAPGLAGVVSTVILLGTYVLVAVATIAYVGLGRIAAFDDDAGVLGAVADGVLGSLGFLVVLAVITSGLSSAQTTILPSSRTTLSMARAGAMPRALGAVHPRFLTPHVSTIAIGVLAVAWYVVASLISDNFLFDTLSALSLMIAFYYALTGFACAIYYRHELLRSVRNLLFIGVAPVLGASMLTYLLVESFRDLADPGASYTGESILGVGVPLAIGVGFLLLGVVLMLIWRVTGGAEYFGRRGFERVPPDVAAGRVTVGETAGAPAPAGGALRPTPARRRDAGA